MVRKLDHSDSNAAEDFKFIGWVLAIPALFIVGVALALISLFR